MALNVYILFENCNKMHKKFWGGGCLFVFKTESIKMYENKNYIVHLFLHDNIQPPPSVVHSTLVLMIGLAAPGFCVTGLKFGEGSRDRLRSLAGTLRTKIS